MKSSHFVAAAVAAICATQAGSAVAGDVQPGDYAWVGAGRTLVLAYAQNQKADSFTLDGQGAVPNAEMDANILILRGVHYREIGGEKFALHVIAPIGDFQTLKLGGADQKVNDGFGDLTLGVTWYPTVSDDAKGTTLGASMFVTAPTGSFDNDSVNFGNGTWSVTPQIGLVQGLGNGFFLDASAEATFYKDFTEAGTDYSRDPTAQLQAYVRYQYSDKTAFSLGYTGKTGGDLFTNGVYTGQKTESQQVRLVASQFVTPSQQVQLMLAKDTEADGGFKADSLVQLRLTSVF